MNKLLSVHEVLQQNPERPCPQSTLDDIGVMEVAYVDFGNQERLGQIAVSHTAMAEVEAFFRQAHEIGFPIAHVVPAVSYGWDDERLMANNVSSGFNYRLIAGTDRPSLHALGLAFDINPVQNPYIRYGGGTAITQPQNAEYNPDAPGTLYAEHPLVKLMEGFGWEWGGHWTPESGRTDYQHFQKNIS